MIIFYMTGFQLGGKTCSVDFKQRGWSNRYGSNLADLVSGKRSVKKSEHEITCFVNNIGMGLQFAAVGALILKKVKELSVWKDLPCDWFTESVHH